MERRITFEPAERTRPGSADRRTVPPWTRGVAAAAAVLAVGWAWALTRPAVDGRTATLWDLYGTIGSPALPVMGIGALVFAALAFGLDRATPVAVGLLVGWSPLAVWSLPDQFRVLTERPSLDGAGAGFELDVAVRFGLLALVVTLAVGFVVRCRRRGWGPLEGPSVDWREPVAGGIAIVTLIATWSLGRWTVDGSREGVGQLRTWPPEGSVVDWVNWFLGPAVVLAVFGATLLWRPVGRPDGRAAATRAGIWIGAALAAAADLVVRALSTRASQDRFSGRLVPAIGPMVLTVLVAAGFLGAAWVARAGGADGAGPTPDAGS